MRIKEKSKWSIIVILTIIAYAFFPLAPAEAVPKIRIAGHDRYDTASEIAKAGWAESDYALLAYGENYPDALAAAPLAYKCESRMIKKAHNKKDLSKADY